jgi:lipocalin
LGTPVKPTLYPNPATNDIVINVECPTFTSFTIYNAVGQTMISQEIASPQMKVNVNTFPAGEYQVIFKGDEKKEMIRFVKW